MQGHENVIIVSPPSTTAALRSEHVPGGGDNDTSGHGLGGVVASVTSQEHAGLARLDTIAG